MRRLLLALALALTACPATPADTPDAGTRELPEPGFHTPRWAFEPWISKDISNRADTLAFVDGFKSRDIPVGTVVLDSPWETSYNTFVPNPARYGDFGTLVSGLKSQGIRTVLWITPLVNTSSFDLEPGGDTYSGEAPNFFDADDRGYLVNSGETYEWWKGIGGAIDFFHPDARDWWHAQQDALLDLGVAGWKLDFGEEYVTTRPIVTHAGPKSLQEYSEAYYRDFLAYGVSKRGTEEFVSMARPWDESYGFPGRFFARKEHCRLGWVGDNRRDFVGLSDALDHLFRSAAAGYQVIGSDIGGYLDKDDLNLAGPTIPFSVDVFLRWTAVGALTPFMQLHGRANITPWTVPERVDETVAAYRYWSWFHSDLVPFLYSLSEEGPTKDTTVMRPIGAPETWPGDYRWMLGDALLVAPILDETGVRDVRLPEGANWLDFWDLEGPALTGGTNLARFDVGRADRIPLFLKEGALLPLDVRNDVTGLGTSAHAGHLTLLAWPATTASQFVLHDAEGGTTTIAANRDDRASAVLLTRSVRPLLLVVRAAGPVTRVTVDDGGGAAVEVPAVDDLFAQASGWRASGDGLWVRVRLPPTSSSRTVRVSVAAP